MFFYVTFNMSCHGPRIENSLATRVSPSSFLLVTVDKQQ